MNLLQMSFTGAVMILAIIMIRSLMLHKLPKVTFIILWGFVLLRLLVPFQIPSAFSIYSLLESAFGERSVQTIELMSAETDGRYRNEMSVSDGESFMDRTVSKAGYALQSESGEIAEVLEISEDVRISSVAEGSESAGKAVSSALLAIWLIGVTLCAGYFMIIYFKCRKEFQMSLPVENKIMEQWLERYTKRYFLIRSPIQVRQSDCISAPLSYGIIAPVILLPKTTDWKDEETLQYILEHEWVHIKRHDMFLKLVMTAAACIHWFNPFVWIMYYLLNRDMELACDEAVIWHFGEKEKSLYARILIYMEEKRSGLMPFYTGFSKNAIEERIKAIMKMKKNSIMVWIGAIVIVVCVIAAFGTSARKSDVQDIGLMAENSEKQEISSITESGDVREIGAAAENSRDQAQLIETSEGAQDVGEDFSLVENNGYTGTTEPEFLEEYEKYGVSYKDNRLYYKGERIRYFLDGYEEEGNTFGRYLSWDAAGTVDVHTVRNDIQKEDGSIELFGDIVDIVASSQEEFDARDVNAYGKDGDMAMEAVTETVQELENAVSGNAPVYLTIEDEDKDQSQTIKVESVSEAQGDGSSGGGGGRSFEEIFKTYEHLGITYEKTTDGLGNLYWTGIAVNRLSDNWSKAAFSFESSDGGEINVIVVHDENGNPNGLVTARINKND